MRTTRTPTAEELERLVGWPPGPEEGPNVVAEILSDGTVRSVTAAAAPAAETERWAEGRIDWQGWSMWWQRRSYDA